MLFFNIISYTPLLQTSLENIEIQFHVSPYESSTHTHWYTILVTMYTVCTQINLLLECEHIFFLCIFLHSAPPWNLFPSHCRRHSSQVGIRPVCSIPSTSAMMAHRTAIMYSKISRRFFIAQTCIKRNARCKNKITR